MKKIFRVALGLSCLAGLAIMVPAGSADAACSWKKSGDMNCGSSGGSSGGSGGGSAGSGGSSSTAGGIFSGVTGPGTPLFGAGTGDVAGSGPKYTMQEVRAVYDDLSDEFQDLPIQWLEEGLGHVDTLSMEFQIDYLTSGDDIVDVQHCPCSGEGPIAFVYGTLVSTTGFYKCNGPRDCGTQYHAFPGCTLGSGMATGPSCSSLSYGGGSGGGSGGGIGGGSGGGSGGHLNQK